MFAAMKTTGPGAYFWLSLHAALLVFLVPAVGGADDSLGTRQLSLSEKTNRAASQSRERSDFFTPPTGACSLASAVNLIRDGTRAAAIVDARLYELIAPTLEDYLEAAARRRRFGIALLPILALDDQRPEQVRAALQSWHAAKPELEGVLFVGNIKLPSFFLPRADIHSVRLWPRFFEDLDMTVTQRVAPGTMLKGHGAPAESWPKIVGVDALTVPPHDFDDLAEGPGLGPELWAAFLPVGFADPGKNNYAGWAGQLERFFKKATAFHKGEVAYGRGLYLVSNDLGLLERAKPAWDAVGAAQIEFYAINEKGPGAFKNNPAGYQRVNLEKCSSLEGFLAYARTLPWMDEGWQSGEVFLRHMAESRRRVVWWNVHSNPELSLVSWEQGRDLRNGGLIALLNGCSVGGFAQPGSNTAADTKVAPERNVLVNLVCGQSGFVAAMGSVRDRVTDERATPLLRHLYAGGYLGRAHFLRLQQQDRDVQGNPSLLREFQEMLIGDPFADAESVAATNGPAASGELFDSNPHDLPELVEADYIELAKIAGISKFRSAAGHDYSDGFESCRSMKHYFKPGEDIDWSGVKIFSPVTGVVLRTEEEWAGNKMEIQADKCPAFTFIIFHVKLDKELRQGGKVAAGQVLGCHVGKQTCSDIAVSIDTPKGRRLVSYFEVMPDRLFERYRARGLASREAVIISKELRDAHPLTCRDGEFTSRGQGQDWMALSRTR